MDGRYQRHLETRAREIIEQAIDDLVRDVGIPQGMKPRMVPTIIAVTTNNKTHITTKIRRRVTGSSLCGEFPFRYPLHRPPQRKLTLRANVTLHKPKNRSFRK